MSVDESEGCGVGALESWCDESKARSDTLCTDLEGFCISPAAAKAHSDLP